jgi:hypothetical protein
MVSSLGHLCHEIIYNAGSIVTLVNLLCRLNYPQIMSQLYELKKNKKSECQLTERIASLSLTSPQGWLTKVFNHQPVQAEEHRRKQRHLGQCLNGQDPGDSSRVPETDLQVVI